MSAPAPAPVVQPGGIDEPRLAHLVCGICYPRVLLVRSGPAIAVCGVQVHHLAPGDVRRCPVCQAMECLPTWPCGH